MISEFFLNLSSTVTGWFLGLFTGVTLPDWLLNLDEPWNKLTGALDGVAVWAPWPFVIGVTVACLATFFVCLVIKYGRAIASYLPFFGGAG